MNATSAEIVAVVAGRDDQRAEDEEREHLEDRADVLGELDERVGDLVLGGAQRDPGDEGGDQPVAERDVGEAEGGEAEADRVDALVAGRDAPAGERSWSLPPSAPSATPDDGAERRLAEELRGLRARVAGAATRGDGRDRVAVGVADRVVVGVGRALVDRRLFPPRERDRRRRVGDRDGVDCSVPSKRPSFGVASTRTLSPLLGLSGLIIAPVQLVGT